MTSPGRRPRESTPIPGSNFHEFPFLCIHVGFILHSVPHTCRVSKFSASHAQSWPFLVHVVVLTDGPMMVRTQTLKVKDHERHLKKVEELVQQKLSRQLPEDDNVFETIKGAGVWGAVEINNDY